MMTFIFNKNGKYLCTAGMPGTGNLTANLVCNPKDPDGRHLSIDVGGIDATPGQAARFLHWCREHLEAGDEISIRIVEADECDAPIETTMYPPEEIVLQSKKECVRRMCEELGWQLIERE